MDENENFRRNDRFIAVPLFQFFRQPAHDFGEIAVAALNHFMRRRADDPIKNSRCTNPCGVLSSTTKRAPLFGNCAANDVSATARIVCERSSLCPTNQQIAAALTLKNRFRRAFDGIRSTKPNS